MAAGKIRGRSDRGGTSKRRQARILAEADRTSDVAAAARHGIADRTIRTWRAKLHQDPELAGEYASVVRALDTAWASELKAHVSRCLARVEELLPALDAKQFPGLSNHVGRCVEQLVAHEALSGGDEDDRPGEGAPPNAQGAARRPSTH